MPSRQHLDNKSSQESAALPLVLPILYCLVSRGKRSKGNMLPRVWRQGDEQVWPGANVNKRESLAPCWGEFRGSFLSHGTTSVVNSTGPYTEQRASAGMSDTRAGLFEHVHPCLEIGLPDTTTHIPHRNQDIPTWFVSLWNWDIYFLINVLCFRRKYLNCVNAN